MNMHKCIVSVVSNQTPSALSADTSVIMFMHMSGICCSTLACFVKFFPTRSEQSDPYDSFKRQLLYQLDLVIC